MAMSEKTRMRQMITWTRFRASRRCRHLAGAARNEIMKGTVSSYPAD
jgi:hypothetical protein